MYGFLQPPLESSKNTKSSVSFCHSKHVTVSFQKPLCLHPPYSERQCAHGLPTSTPTPTPTWTNPTADILVPIGVLYFIVSVLITLRKLLCCSQSPLPILLNHNHPTKCLDLCLFNFTELDVCSLLSAAVSHCSPQPTAQESEWAGRITCRVIVCSLHAHHLKTQALLTHSKGKTTKYNSTILFVYLSTWSPKQST